MFLHIILRRAKEETVKGALTVDSVVARAMKVREKTGKWVKGRSISKFFHYDQNVSISQEIRSVANVVHSPPPHSPQTAPVLSRKPGLLRFDNFGLIKDTS